MQTYHLPQFVRPRELPTSSLEYISLLMNTSMLKLQLDVHQPRLDTSRIPQNILLVDRVFFGLQTSQLRISVCRIRREGSLQSGTNLVFLSRASIWLRREQPLWAEAHQAFSACCEKGEQTVGGIDGTIEE
jgi:hypothetical protein